MRRRRLAAAFLLASAAAAPDATGSIIDAAVRTFLGDPAIRILQGATRVETFRLKSSPVIDPAATGPKIDRYPIASTGPERDAKFAARIAAVLLDAKTYSFDSAKGCIFNPGVVFRIWAGKECVEVVLCFDCTELKLIVKDAVGAEIRKAGEDFDGARTAFVRLAQDAFPTDPTIQALK